MATPPPASSDDGPADFALAGPAAALSSAHAASSSAISLDALASASSSLSTGLGGGGAPASAAASCRRSMCFVNSRCSNSYVVRKDSNFLSTLSSSGGGSVCPRLTNRAADGSTRCARSTAAGDNQSQKPNALGKPVYASVGRCHRLTRPQVSSSACIVVSETPSGIRLMKSVTTRSMGGRGAALGLSVEETTDPTAPELAPVSPGPCAVTGLGICTGIPGGGRGGAAGGGG